MNPIARPPTAELDATTVLEMHRMAREDLPPLGFIANALSAGRQDVLEILHAAGEFDHPGVAGESYTRVFRRRDLASLDWLISKRLVPARDPAFADVWLGLQATYPDGGWCWEQGLVRLLQAGVVEPDDRLATVTGETKSLLDFALVHRAEDLATQILTRKGVSCGGMSLLVQALERGCPRVAELAAASIESVTVGSVWKLAEAADAYRPSKDREGAQQVRQKLRSVVGALITRALEAPEIESEHCPVSGYVRALQYLEWPQQPRAVIRRWPYHVRDELLREACCMDAHAVAQVLLEEGARVDATEGGRRDVQRPRGVPANKYSPHAIHNVRSEPLMRMLILVFGADVHARWGGKSTLHWMIKNFSGVIDQYAIEQGKQILDLLAQNGVDFAERGDRASIKKMAEGLSEDLRRHLMAIRTGVQITSAMSEPSHEERVPGKPAASGAVL